MGTHKPPANDVARRILAVAAYRGFDSMTAFSGWLELPNNQRVGNVIRGAALSKDLAFIISKKTGVSPLWLWHGDRSGVPGDLLKELDRHLLALEEEPRHGAS